MTAPHDTDKREASPAILFNAGYDTLQVAAMTGRTEAEVYNALHRIRERRHRQRELREIGNAETTRINEIEARVKAAGTGHAANSPAPCDAANGQGTAAK